LPWVLGFFVLATLGFTMVSIPYGAMAGEITQDPSERSAMTAWRMGFASVGILVGGALIPGIAAGSNYAQAALVASPLIIGAIWLSVFATRHAPRDDVPSSASPLRMMRLVLGNRAFVALAAVYGVMTLAVALITAGLPFAAVYLVADTGDTLLSGAARALTVLSLMFAAFTVGSILSQAQIPWAMYPDLMDVTRAQSGEAIEGAFSAIWLFGQKAANAFAPLILGVILSFFGWVETTQGQVEQTEQAVKSLQWAVTLVPAGIIAVSIVLLLVLYRPLAKRVSHVA